ncbi:Ig-like domain-containing protein [Longivirga aurantiaca]|uniref:Ig-like domain-containing protein n=1 Tax=Longivirga aurantiaca TaxID=1837743 RepID=A0ABW1T055_9ACTN
MSTFRRRVVAVAAAAVVLTILPQTPAMAVDDSVVLTGLASGQYIATGVTASIGADASTGDLAQSVDLYVDGSLEESQACPVPDVTCTVSFTFDTATLADGSHTAEVRLTTDVGTDVASDSVSFFVGNRPTVVITAPEPGTYAGVIDIDVTGTTDAQGTDYPATFQLLVGGNPVGSPLGACAGNAKICDRTFSWDTSALSAGLRSVSVEMTTDQGTVRESAAVAITVADPPSVTIESPTSGTFSGTIVVSVTGSTDPAGNDYPTQFALLLGGSPIAGVTSGPCPGNADTCTKTLTWDVSAVPAGSKTLSVRMTTHQGLQRTSPPVTVAVASAPTVSITSPAQNAVLVPGTTSVTIAAATDTGLGQVAKTLELYVDGGGTPVATTTCTGSEVPCSKTVTWNTSALALNSTHTLVARVVAGGVTVDTGVRTVRIAAAPVISALSPTTGSTNVLPSSTDVVSFSVTGAGDSGLGSRAKTFELFVDGALTAVDSATCSPSSGSCTVGLDWDASAVTGGTTHTALVRLTVDGMQTTRSTTFTLADAPTVTVVPQPGGTVSGATSITVTAQTDADTTEDPQSVVLTALPGAGPALVFPAEPCDSAPVDGACTFTIPWDVSLLSGSFTLTAQLTADSGRTRTSPGVVVDVDNPGPVITVTAPTASVVKGRVLVRATARIGTAVTGHVTTLRIFAGGQQIGATKTCSADVTPCTYSATWDTTLLRNATGVQVFARVTTSTTGAQTFNSTGTFVRLLNPKPVVTWISPTNGDVVSGSAVAIKVGLKTDLSQSDLPKTASIFRNGSSTPFDTFTCAGTSHSCIATFTWNASRSAGLSTFVVKVRTTKERLGGSTTSRKLYASSSARVAYSTVSTVDNGTRVTISGRVVAVRTGLPLAGAKIALVRDPAIGSTVRGTLTTSSTGRFSVTFTATSNTRVTATTVSLRTPLGEIYVPPASATASQMVRAPMACRVANSVLGPNQSGRGSCSVAGLPVGTPLILRYLYGGVWRTLATGTSSSTTIPFTYQFPAKGFYQLRVILSGNRVYAGTNSILMPVTVR